MPKNDILPQKDKAILHSLEEKMGYTFSNPSFLLNALTHSSFAYEQSNNRKDNETLEFLGDAVLDLVIGSILFKCFPEMKEGELTRLRAALVNESNLAFMADGIELGSYIFLGRGEDTTGGRKKASILASAYEALIGAIFLDNGYGEAHGFVERYFVPMIEQQKHAMLHADTKSRLQEKIQEKYHEAPTYRIDKEDGPDHDKEFTVSVLFRDKVLGTGRAGNKKVAEQQAATAALQDLSDILEP